MKEKKKVRKEYILRKIKKKNFFFLIIRTSELHIKII